LIRALSCHFELSPRLAFRIEKVLSLVRSPTLRTFRPLPFGLDPLFRATQLLAQCAGSLSGCPGAIMRRLCLSLERRTPHS
jgi:hypothetical protein